MEIFKRKDNDPWRRAILIERERCRVHPEMQSGLELVSEKGSALVLGDASQIQSKYLLEEQGFLEVVDVDSSPSLLDDLSIEGNLKKVQSTFVDYGPPEDSFDFVYGKSIAFNPKDSILEVLFKIEKSLKSNGIYVGVYAGEGDSYRPVFYTKEELLVIHKEVGFNIVNVEVSVNDVMGLIKPGVSHHIVVTARKRYS